MKARVLIAFLDRRGFDGLKPSGVAVSGMRHDDIQFHNAAELRDVADADGTVIQRVPEDVRQELNEGAQRRMRHPAGVELRFVPEGTVEVTLSVTPGGSAEKGRGHVFWGPFQGESFEIRQEPTTVELATPERMTELHDEALSALAFDPRVCRVCLSGEHRGGYTLYHGATGDRRPPRPDQLPDRRYLAYGTSITEGEAALADHLTYVGQTAQRLGADLINLGSCGTAYCDEAMAAHIAERGDWDVATLALSVNMVEPFTPAEFRERASHMVERVASANPDCPVACITIFRGAEDVMAGGAGEQWEPFRVELRDIVAASDCENVFLLEGQDLLPDAAGLTTDLVHPGDRAMRRIAEHLAPELEGRLGRGPG